MVNNKNEDLKITNEDYSEMIIIRGPVIASGVTDSYDNTLNDKQIKELYISFKTQETDLMHNLLPNHGVTIIGNTILDYPKTIQGNKLLAGTWYGEMLITNQDLIRLIKNGELTGFSPCTVPDFATKSEYWLNNRTPTENNYNVIEDWREAEVRFISIVDKPSHKLAFEWLEIDDYINQRMNEKSIKEEEIMTKENENQESIFGGVISTLVNALITRSDKPTPEPEDKKVEDKVEFVTPKDLDDKFTEFKKELKTELQDLLKKPEGEKPKEDNPEDKKPEDKKVEDTKSPKEEKPKEDNPEDKKNEDKKSPEDDPESKKPENVETPTIERSFQDLRAEKRKVPVKYY